MTTTTTTASHHLLSLRVENRAGVLVRIAGLFARRGYNIVSLAVAPTDDVAFSRVSIVVDVESAPLQQVRDQLDKLVNVVEITELHSDDALEAELLLATVDDGAARLDAACAAAGAEIVDRAHGRATVRLTAHPDSLDAFEDELRAFSIVALQRTGRVGLPKLA